MQEMIKIYYLSFAKQCLYLVPHHLINVNLKGNDIMKDSTALILSSLVFFILTIFAVIISAPVSACGILCLCGAVLMGGGFVALNHEQSII